MDIVSDRRKRLLKQYFNSSGLLIMSLLGIVGLIMIYYSKVFTVYDKTTLIECLSKNGIMIIFGLFFFIVSLYCWVLTLLNVFLKPIKEVMYVYKDIDGEVTLINQKGKKFDYIFDTRKIDGNCYYNVIRTFSYVYYIDEKTSANWEPVEKKSYWFNYYTPYGNFENIFILPILYVILAPGILSIILSDGGQKIFGFLYCVVPGFFLIYDAVHKIRMKNDIYEPIDLSNFKKIFSIIGKIVSLAVLLVLCYFIIKLAIEIDEGKPFVIIFGSAFICAVSYNIASIFNMKKLSKILIKVYLLLFILFAISLIIFQITSKDTSLLIVSIIILFMLIIMSIKEFKKSKTNENKNH